MRIGQASQEYTAAEKFTFAESDPKVFAGGSHYVTDEAAKAAAASAPQVVVSALTVGYALRKLLPRSAAEAHLSTSFHNALKRGRLHTLVTAAFSPVGLVHWLHAVLAVLAIAPDMAPEYGRKGLLGLYVAAGAAASLGSVLGGVLARRRSVARPSVSARRSGRNKTRTDRYRLCRRSTPSRYPSGSLWSAT